MMSLYFAFNRGYRAHPMPHTLEAFKLVEVANMRTGRMVVALMCGVFFGILASFWAYLVVSYNIGANPGLGSGGYNLLRSWLYYPTETNIPAVAFMGVGFLFTGFLWWLRTRFPMFPFHPTGYAVASSMWTFGWLWFSVLISWAIKNLILRFGGIRLYHKVLTPLFRIDFRAVHCRWHLGTHPTDLANFCLFVLPLACCNSEVASIGTQQIDPVYALYPHHHRIPD